MQSLLPRDFPSHAHRRRLPPHVHRAVCDACREALPSSKRCTMRSQRVRSRGSGSTERVSGISGAVRFVRGLASTRSVGWLGIPKVLVSKAGIGEGWGDPTAVGFRDTRGPGDLVPPLDHTAFHFGEDGFGFVAVVAAHLARRAEPGELEDLRRLEAGGGLRAWLGTRAMAQAPALLAAGAGMFLLSLHEIESAVTLTPPGSDNLPRFLLNLLHYNRQEELTAGMLVVAGGGLAVALMAAGVIGAAPRMRRRR